MLCLSRVISLSGKWEAWKENHSKDFRDSVIYALERPGISNAVGVSEVMVYVCDDSVFEIDSFLLRARGPEHRMGS